MFKHYFEGISYIEVGPIIGLVVFFVFFVALVYMVIKTDSGFITKMKNMPLEDTDHAGTNSKIKSNLNSIKTKL